MTSGRDLHTPVCDLLRIEVPVVQAGMAPGYTSPELVAAVSEAGGLGILGALFTGAEELQAAIIRTRELTSKPFGVNHVISQLDREAFEVTLEHEPAVLSLAWGDSPPLTEQAHERGMRVIHQVTTITEATAAVASGADVIVAQGTEGGGHVGGISTLPFVPAVVDAVAPVPVLAAGGIADGRGLAAVLALGAQGALMGTRFLATPEAPVSQRFKQALLASRGSDTVASKYLDDVLGLDWPGAQVRTLRHPLLDDWTDRPGQWKDSADQLRPQLVDAVFTGDFVLAGEAVGLIDDIVPAGTLVGRIADEAAQALTGKLEG
jgi:NAD(P)H-dependent flavin oxidoreductase YrpB (nitropropane dioxygenase family)